MQHAIGFALVGCTWGLIAALLSAKAMGPTILVGVVASPVIGIVVGKAIHHRFAAAGRGGRVMLALASLYIGATLFGCAVGLGDWFAGRAGGNIEVLWEGVIAVWYGTTLFAIALWPMAYVSHVALASDVAWWRRPSS